MKKWREIINLKKNCWQIFSNLIEIAREEKVRKKNNVTKKDRTIFPKIMKKAY